MLQWPPLLLVVSMFSFENTHSVALGLGVYYNKACCQHSVNQLTVFPLLLVNYLLYTTNCIYIPTLWL